MSLFRRKPPAEPNVEIDQKRDALGKIVDGVKQDPQLTAIEKKQAEAYAKKRYRGLWKKRIDTEL